MALTKVKVREILSTAGVDADHMSEAVNDYILQFVDNKKRQP